MYEVNKVYIWQNLKGVYEFLNGKETTVTSTLMPLPVEGGGEVMVWLTDTLINEYDGPTYVYAEPGDLRPKDPPSGELSILRLFTVPETELEPA